MINNLAGNRQIANPELCGSCPLRNGCDAGPVIAQEVSVKFQDVGFLPVDNLGLYNVDINAPIVPEKVSEVQIGPKNEQPLSIFRILTKHFHHLEPEFKKCREPKPVVKRGLFRKSVFVGCTALRNLAVE